VTARLVESRNGVIAEEQSARDREPGRANQVGLATTRAKQCRDCFAGHGILTVLSIKLFEE
jgi:hypothetical protein